jgi:hypothetical protein
MTSNRPLSLAEVAATSSALSTEADKLPIGPSRAPILRLIGDVWAKAGFLSPEDAQRMAKTWYDAADACV